MAFSKGELLKHTLFFKRCVADYYVQYGRQFPWRIDRTPYSVMVSEFMLQRTRASNVVQVYESFLETYPSLKSLLTADLSDLEYIMHPLGLPARAKRILEAASEIDTQYNGVIPRSFNELKSVRGIGDYTAGAILCFGFGEAVGILDINVYRLIGRFFGVYSIKNEPHYTNEIKEIVASLVNESRPIAYNYGLLDIAAQYCRSRKVDCNNCTLKKFCSYVKMS